jgi:CheY-like chemotaxis protein
MSPDTFSLHAGRSKPLPKTRKHFTNQGNCPNQQTGDTLTAMGFANHSSNGLSAQAIRLLVIDDHLVFREALAHALEGEAGFQVVARADDGQAGMEAWRRHRPDVTLLGASEAGAGAIRTLRGIRSIDAAARVLVLAWSQQRHDAAAALDAGAVAYATKTTDLPPLMEPVSINRVSLPMDRPCPLAEA